MVCLHRMAARTLLAAAVVVSTWAETTCQSFAGIDTRLVASMERNATGHWLVAVEMEQKLPVSRQRDSPSMHFEALPTLKRSGDTITHAMRITLVGLPYLVNTDYVYISGAGYYRMHEERVTWIEAKHICEKENAQLLVINSMEEAMKLKEHITKHPKLSDWIYIGIFKKDNWVTIYGETLQSAGYDRWLPGESHSVYEIYGCISKDVELASCTVGIGSFICEQNI